MGVRIFTFIVVEACCVYLIHTYGNLLFNYVTFEVFFVNSYLIIHCLETDYSWNKFVMLVSVLLLILYSLFLLILE